MADKRKELENSAQAGAGAAADFRAQIPDARAAVSRYRLQYRLRRRGGAAQWFHRHRARTRCQRGRGGGAAVSGESFSRRHAGDTCAGAIFRFGPMHRSGRACSRAQGFSRRSRRRRGAGRDRIDHHARCRAPHGAKRPSGVARSQAARAPDAVLTRRHAGGAGRAIRSCVDFAQSQARASGHRAQESCPQSSRLSTSPAR